MAKSKNKSKKKKKVHAAKKGHGKVDVKSVEAAPKKEQKRKTSKKAHAKDAPKKSTKSDKKVEQGSKTPAKKISLLTNIKNKFASLLLIITGLLAVVFVGIFFVQKALQPVKLAKLLPHENTVMMAEFDLLELLGDVDGAQKLANDGPVADLILSVEDALAVDFTESIKPWLGVKHGYALLNIENEDGSSTYEHVVFVQSINRDATMKFLSGFKLESHQDSLESMQYKNYPLYSFSVGQNVHFLVLDRYFVFGESKEALKQIVDVYTGEVEELAHQKEFLKVKNNVKKDIGFVYYIPARLFDYYTGDQLTSSSSLIRPVLSLFDSQGHSIILEEDSLVVQTYMNFSTGGANEELLSQLNAHYNAELLAYMPADFEYFWGSQNLAQVVSDFGVVLNKLHPSSFNILEGVLNAKKEQYFGYEIDLREDIYEVFENEFALALYAEPDHIDYLFIAQNQNEERIGRLQAVYLETMTEQGYAVLADEDEVEDVEVSTDEEITAFPFDARTNMYTAMYEGNLLMSTDRTLIESVLSSGQHDTDDLRIHSYLKDFDELNIMSPAFMGELLGEKALKYLDNFTRIQAAKSIFLDGMALVHVFEF